MPSNDKMKARKASWLAFGIVALAAVASASTSDSKTAQEPLNVPPPTAYDALAESNRAYRQAMSTLSSLNAQTSPYGHDRSTSKNYPSKLMQSVLYGQGALADTLRVAVRYQERVMKWITPEITSRRRTDDFQGKAIKVLDLLQHAAELGNMDALYTLAKISLFPPNFYLPSAPRLAYETYEKHATLTGNATSQAMLAFFHGTGYHDIVPINQAKAQLYYNFAAQQGHKGAQMAMGYRHWSGIATNEDCSKALVWYQSASQQSMDTFLQGPPGGRTLPLAPYRHSDLAGGPYGAGASVASTGFNAYRASIKAGTARRVGETWDDIIDYLEFNAGRRETDFTIRLAKLYYQGSIYPVSGGIASGAEGAGAVPKNLKRAHAYFLSLARLIWPHDPPHAQASHSKEKEEPNYAKYAATSAGYLGRMYLRGEGVKQDLVKAKLWFDRGASLGDKESQNGLGIMIRDGLIGKANPDRANIHFTSAASQDLAEAHVNLGKSAFYRANFKDALAYFEMATQHGSPFEAYYYLGVIQGRLAQGQGQGPSAGACAAAVSFHKIVSERGVWDEDLLFEADKAWDSGTDRGKEMALLRLWIAAERGFEVAQTNIAFELDQDKSLLRSTRFSPTVPSNDTAKLALLQWTRAAAQRNVDALVKVGDYYYHGLGDSDTDAQTRYTKAIKYYQAAADTQMSALAMWNLGWMYENGVGVPQDFHLAKRNYDLALEANTEAFIPVRLSLIKLYFRSFWHTMRGGKKGLNLWKKQQEPLARRKAAQNEKLDSGHSDEAQHESSHQHEEEPEDDGPWYLGKAKDDLSRRTRANARRQGDEEDIVEWTRERRAAQAEMEGEFGPEDYFDGAMRVGGGEMTDDEMIEIIFLFAILAGVAILMVVRQRLMERIRRQEAEIQQLQEGVAALHLPGRPQTPPPAAFANPDAPIEDWQVL